MKAPILVLVALTALVATPASAHFRFVDPSPRSTSSGIKTGPCGSDGFNDGPMNLVTPGQVYTIELEETINHNGAPFTVAFSYNDDTHYNELILEAHIPHNDGGTKNYLINVTIPDVNVSRAALSIVNPMTDKIAAGSCCCYTPINSGPEAALTPRCFSVYHSCANLNYSTPGAIDPATFESNHVNSDLWYVYQRESCTWIEVTPGVWERGPDCAFNATQQAIDCEGYCGLAAPTTTPVPTTTRDPNATTPVPTTTTTTTLTPTTTTLTPTTTTLMPSTSAAPTNSSDMPAVSGTQTAPLAAVVLAAAVACLAAVAL